MTEKPRITIGIGAYNHQDYIETTIKSVLAQKTSFIYKIAIADDCSNDNTLKNIKKLKSDFPDKIELVIYEKNIGIFNVCKNFVLGAQSDYLAFLDGDDYYSDENKLQKQVDFLDKNPEYSACFHDVRIQNNFESGNKEFDYYSQFKTYSQFNEYNTEVFPEQIIKRLIIPTSSIVCRSTSIKSFFENSNHSNLSLIWKMQLHMIKNSKFKYFNEVCSVYNNHKQGASKKNSLEVYKTENIKILESLIYDDFYCNYKHVIYKSILREYNQLLFEHSSAFQPKRLLLYNFYSYCFTVLKSIYFDIGFIAKKILTKDNANKSS